ncbi:MAG: hypothetical protein WBX15_14450, partial [Thermoanaerobaculia bacterium]
LPFYPIKGYPVQHFAGIVIGENARVNLGLYNGLSYAVPEQLTLYDAEGTQVASVTVTVQPHETLQSPIQSFVGDLPDGVYGLTVLPQKTEAGPGGSWAYVSIVDDKTGDPTNFW